MHRLWLPSSQRSLVQYALLALAAVVGMAMFFGPSDNWMWDPSFYYAHIRSPLIENDLDFRNETNTGSVQTGYTVTGLQNSPWPIGPSILWSPWFLIAHLATLLTNPGQANGFYFTYISLVSLGSAVYGVGGLWVVYRVCRYFSSKAHALIAALLCLGATPLFFYVFRQPMMAHTTGLLASATMLLTYMVLADRETFSPKSGILFGPALGICFATRWTGLLMAIVPVMYLADHLAKAVRRRSWHEAKRIVLQVPVLLGTFYLTISPQLVLLYRLHHRFIVVPQPPSSFVDSILPVNLWKIFTHTNRGLIFWCPFVLVGSAGIVLIPNVKTRLMAAIAVTSHLVLLGYRVDWFGGGGFGARYFIEILPFVAIGFVCVLRKVPARAGFKLLIAFFTVALLVHQLVLMYAFEHQADGWPDPSSSIADKPLGVRWQLDSFTELAWDPSLWFTPRPHIGTDRQTIVTNIRAGVLDPHAYRVTGTATVLAPIVVLMAVLLQRFASTTILPVLPEGTMAYFFAWAVYLFQVG